MNVFIDAISSPCVCHIFDNKRQITKTALWDIKGNESSILIPKLEGFLQDTAIDFFDLENIVVVNGPGSFTGVRTVILMVNTISYLSGAKMTALGYFDLLNNYPIIKSSSKRDCFFQKNQDSEIEIIPNNQIIEFCDQQNIQALYGEASKGIFQEIEILDNIDYESIIRNVRFADTTKVEPLYIKKPNIS